MYRSPTANGGGCRGITGLHERRWESHTSTKGCCRGHYHVGFEMDAWGQATPRNHLTHRRGERKRGEEAWKGGTIFEYVICVPVLQKQPIFSCVLVSRNSWLLFSSASGGETHPCRSRRSALTVLGKPCANYIEYSPLVSNYLLEPIG